MGFYINSIKNSKFEGQRVDFFDISHKEKPTVNSQRVRDLSGNIHLVKFFEIRSDDITSIEKLALQAYYEKYKSNSIDCDNVNYRIKVGTNFLVISQYGNASSKSNSIQFVSSNKEYLSYSDMINDLKSTTSTTKGLVYNVSADNGSMNDAIVLINTTYLSEQYIGFCFFNSTGVYRGGYVFNFSDLNQIAGRIQLGEHSRQFGDYSDSGGYGGGSFDNTSDSFGEPSLPKLGISNAGMVNVYKITPNQLNGFADDLFPDISIPEPSEKSGLDGVVENLGNMINTLGELGTSFINQNLINYVLDCHVVPCNPTTTSNNGIKVGFKTFKYNPDKVTSDYVVVDCGSLSIAEYYQNFLDYQGTRATLYLPFIGFVPIKNEWWQAGTIQVKYHFNVIDGSCIAFVIASSSKSELKNTVTSTYSSSCCLHLPITGLNYASMISGTLGAINSVDSKIVETTKTVGKSKVTEQNRETNVNVGGLANSVVEMLSPQVQQSNGYSSSTSFMAYRTPYLLIERPVASFSQKYPSEQGLPLNVTMTLNELTGMTVAYNLLVDYLTCTSEEKDMIKTIFAEGVIL